MDDGAAVFVFGNAKLPAVVTKLGFAAVRNNTEMLSKAAGAGVAGKCGGRNADGGTRTDNVYAALHRLPGRDLCLAAAQNRYRQNGGGVTCCGPGINLVGAGRAAVCGGDGQIIAVKFRLQGIRDGNLTALVHDGNDGRGERIAAESGAQTNTDAVFHRGVDADAGFGKLQLDGAFLHGELHRLCLDLQSAFGHGGQLKDIAVELGVQRAARLFLQCDRSRALDAYVEKRGGVRKGCFAAHGHDSIAKILGAGKGVVFVSGGDFGSAAGNGEVNAAAGLHGGGQGRLAVGLEIHRERACLTALVGADLYFIGLGRGEVNAFFGSHVDHAVFVPNGHVLCSLIGVLSGLVGNADVRLQHVIVCGADGESDGERVRGLGRHGNAAFCELDGGFFDLYAELYGHLLVRALHTDLEGDGFACGGGHGEEDKTAVGRVPVPDLISLRSGKTLYMQFVETLLGAFRQEPELNALALLPAFLQCYGGSGELELGRRSFQREADRNGDVLCPALHLCQKIELGAALCRGIGQQTELRADGLHIVRVGFAAVQTQAFYFAAGDLRRSGVAVIEGVQTDGGSLELGQGLFHAERQHIGGDKLPIAYGDRNSAFEGGSCAAVQGLCRGHDIETSVVLYHKGKQFGDSPVCKAGGAESHAVIFGRLISLAHRHFFQILLQQQENIHRCVIGAVKLGCGFGAAKLYSVNAEVFFHFIGNAASAYIETAAGGEFIALEADRGNGIGHTGAEDGDTALLIHGNNILVVFIRIHRPTEKLFPFNRVNAETKLFRELFAAFIFHSQILPVQFKSYIGGDKAGGDIPVIFNTETEYLIPAYQFSILKPTEEYTVFIGLCTELRILTNDIFAAANGDSRPLGSGGNCIFRDVACKLQIGVNHCAVFVLQSIVCRSSIKILNSSCKLFALTDGNIIVVYNMLNLVCGIVFVLNLIGHGAIIGCQRFYGILCVGRQQHDHLPIIIHIGSNIAAVDFLRLAINDLGYQVTRIVIDSNINGAVQYKPAASGLGIRNTCAINGFHPCQTKFRIVRLKNYLAGNLQHFKGYTYSKWQRRCQ